MATTITPPRLIRFAFYYIHVLPFIDIEVEKHNDHVSSSEDDYNMDIWYVKGLWTWLHLFCVRVHMFWI